MQKREGGDLIVRHLNNEIDRYDYSRNRRRRSRSPKTHRRPRD